MNIESTGNVFMAYPEEDMDLDVWEWGKKQNLDVLPYLTISFDYSDRLVCPEGEDPAEYTVLNKSNIDLINTLSDDIWNQINNCESLEKLEELITQWKALGENPTYKNALKAEMSPSEPKEGSTDVPGFFYYYSQWLQDTGLYVPKEE